MAGPRSTSLTQTRVRKAPTLLEEKLFLEAVTTADAKLEKDAKPAPPGGRARRAAISISTSPKASAGILRRRAISVERLVPVAALAEILSPKHGSPKLFSPKNVSTPKPKVMSPKKMAKLLAGSPPRANGRAFTVPVLEYRTEDFLQGQQKNYRNLRIFPDESFGLYPKESEDTESRSPKYLPPGILHELSFEEKLLAIQSARKAARRLSRFSLGSGDLGLDEEGGEVDEERAPVGPREKQQSKKESSHFPARRMTAFDEDIRRAATLAQDEGAVFRKRRASSRSKKSSRGSIDRVEEVAPVSVRASRGPSDIPAPVVVSRNTPPLPSVTVTKEDQPPPRRANAFATVGRSVAAFHRPRLINHAAQLNVPTTTRPLTKQIAEGTNIVEEEFLQKIRANELVGVRDMLNQCAREKRNGAKDLLFSDKVCCKALALAAENRNAEIARLLVKYASASGSLTMVPDPVVVSSPGGVLWFFWVDFISQKLSSQSHGTKCCRCTSVEVDQKPNKAMSAAMSTPTPSAENE